MARSPLALFTRFSVTSLKSGYGKSSALSSVGFNIVASVILLILAAPFFVLLPILIKLQDGGPVFYRGERLGLNKRRFKMYKFRTMVVDAESRIGARMASRVPKGEGQQLITPLGKYLRDTRLDELPQLINVIKGDMELVGPRPEREVVYKKMCAHIPSYDLRFKAKPGVIGHSQLFTPHGTPKRIRTMIDNYFVVRRRRVSLDMIFFFLALILLIRKAFSRTVQVSVRKLHNVVLGQKFSSERRRSERIALVDVMVYVRRLDGAPERTQGLRDCADWSGKLVDISEEALVMRYNESLPDEAVCELLLVRGFKVPWRRREKVKLCHCRGVVMMAKPDGDPEHKGDFLNVMTYSPVSQLNEYKMHKYFLLESIS
jgi:lipopolysaccharide/colanic/teichoic acid biosynthesis glycosyltransferase